MWSGAGIVGDRTLISDFTGKDGSEIGGSPVNLIDCIVQDQSVKIFGKILLVDFIALFRNTRFRDRL